MFRLTAVYVILMSSTLAVGQQSTTTTNCNVYDTTAHCTSTTTDNSAQQQQMYDAGQKVGSGLGQGIAAAMQNHAFAKGLKKYCKAHPGETWTYRSRADGHILSSGTCSTK